MNENLVKDSEREIARFDERIAARSGWIAPILVRAEAISSAELAGASEPVSSIAAAEHSPRSRRAHSRAAELIADHILTVEALGNEAVRAETGGLTRLAMAHAQVAASHRDGYGLAGRVLVQRQLRNLGMTRRLVLPMSAGLLVAPTRYAESLDIFLEGNNEPIISTFVNAAAAAIQNATQLAEEVDSARDAWNDVVTGRSDSSVWPLVSHCASHLAITATSVAVDLEISDVAAQNALDRLAAWGIINQNSMAKRNRIWLVSDVLDAVEAFMARARQAPD